jgi:hypothetical protein
MRQSDIDRVKDQLARATPCPWHYDSGNLEIETHHEKHYRQVVVHVKNDLEDRIKEGRCHYDDDMWLIEGAINILPGLIDSYEHALTELRAARVTLAGARAMLNVVNTCSSHECEDCREHSGNHRNACDETLARIDRFLAATEGK